MQKKYACVRYLHSRVTVYQPCNIDLRYSKALHSCFSCRFLRLGLPCSAIHYGMCRAVPVPVPAGGPPGHPGHPASSSSPSPSSTKSPSSSSSSPSHSPVPLHLHQGQQKQPVPIPVQASSSPSAPPSSSKPAQHPPIPIPVMAVAKRTSPSSPVVVVVSNSNNNNNSNNSVNIISNATANNSSSNNNNNHGASAHDVRVGHPPHPPHPHPHQHPHLNHHHFVNNIPYPQQQPPYPHPHHHHPHPHPHVTSSETSMVSPHGARSYEQTVVVQPRAPGAGSPPPPLSPDLPPPPPPLSPTSVVSVGPNTHVIVRTGGSQGGSGGSVQVGLPQATFIGAGNVGGTAGPAGVAVGGTSSAGGAVGNTGGAAGGLARPGGPGGNGGVRTPVRVVAVGSGGGGGSSKATGGSSDCADGGSGVGPGGGGVFRSTSPVFSTNNINVINNNSIINNNNNNNNSGNVNSLSHHALHHNKSSGVHHFSFSGSDDEVYPAFPVSPEDKLPTPQQLTVPNGTPSKDSQHVLREKDVQPQERDKASGDVLPRKEAGGKDSSKAPTATTTSTTTTAPSITTPSTSSTSITLAPAASPSSSSSSSLIATATTRGAAEDKENKPRSSRELPTPRVPARVRSEDIPQFHFPLGRPQASPPDVDQLLQQAGVEFAKLDGGKAYKQQMGQIAKACGFPLYWKILLFRAAGGDKQGFVTLQSLSTMLRKVFSTCHDDSSKFVRMLAKPGRMMLDFDDLVPLVQDVVDCHPGLTFLQDAPEFHSRYIHTVVSRIFFCVNRSWSGRITVPEIRKSNFLRILSTLDSEEDINQVTEFFSYEHFYVIYCKFWELDKDHDLYIDRADLARHNDHALNSRIIDRIFSGAVTRGKDFQEGRMSYKEFVWFLISEEDKKHPTSIEFWFRCMDLDGDGVISMYEMEYFYEEQMQKMEALGIEKLPFEDCLCQMFDLVRPQVDERITLKDLKNCRMANIFFDTFFNLDKFLEHEQRDPFANARDLDAAGNEISDWDRYAAEEYDVLVAEEGMNDQEEIHYEDDFEPDDDDAVDDEIARLADPPQRKVTPRLHPATNDDLYDFSSNSLGF